eukprot:TRINITY_DN3152_c0_g1_i2.p1 TRINITY_DN3152_c0_g1~~TRINITY_DN3152_c0_g1_i2.p1  ORF type:complete len:117 (+),score=32.29 TRINITY_DN3152_c0_g1_i2:430-780(+)
MIKQADAYLIIYSITSISSFEKIETYKEYILLIKNEENIDLPIVIVGNKCDLDNERGVETSQGLDIAREYDCPFYETSAKERINIEESIFDLVREIRRYYPEKSASESEKKKCILQ